jgi:hypothetical protein
MGNINATFCNNYSESRMWWIYDTKIDPNYPKSIFEGYLASNECTGPLPLETGDDLWGQATYKRSDGAPTVADTITDGSTVQMD